MSISDKCGFYSNLMRCCTWCDFRKIIFWYDVSTKHKKGEYIIKKTKNFKKPKNKKNEKSYKAIYQYACNKHKRSMKLDGLINKFILGKDVSNCTHKQIEYKWDNFLRKNLIFPFTANYNIVINDKESEITV